MPREGTGERRPWKVWDVSRNKKKQVLAASLDELREKGRERFGCSVDEPVRLVLELDGTRVDDNDYLNWLPDNTVFLLLRHGENWTKPGVHHHRQHADPQPVIQEPPIGFRRSDSFTNASPIPRVVCDALNLLEIKHEPPFWKIIDNRGRITLVLHWEQARNNYVRCVEPMRTYDPASMPTAMNASDSAARSFAELKIKSMPLSVNDGVITVMSEDGKIVTTIRGDRIETPIYTAQTPKHAHKEKKPAHEKLPAASSSVPYRVAATLKCPVPPDGAGGSSRMQQPQQQHACQAGDRHHHRSDECEFHCGSLHEEGRSIQGASSSGGRSRGSHASPQQSKSSHVRFSDQDANRMDFGHRGERIATEGSKERASAAAASAESSESEVEPESQTMEEEYENESGIRTEKMLLLTDQLTAEQRKHLTILDLGVILDRLKAKIIDVERLEREREGPTCFRWLIKATIRGKVLRDLGILYNGNYYSISEDPGLTFAASGFEDEEDREDPV